MKTIQLETERLILRQWKKDDFKAFETLNADPIVMEYFPSVLSTEESNALAQKYQDSIERNGWGFWAVEEKSSGAFMGCLGLDTTSSDLPFTPCVEIGWRLLKEYWGKGYATEAGKEVLHFAFEELKLDKVVSFTATINHRSESVMNRLGMQNKDANFEHLALAVGHRLREHVLYGIRRENFHKLGHILNMENTTRDLML